MELSRHKKGGHNSLNSIFTHYNTSDPCSSEDNIFASLGHALAILSVEEKLAIFSRLL